MVQSDTKCVSTTNVNVVDGMINDFIIFQFTSFAEYGTYTCSTESVLEKKHLTKHTQTVQRKHVQHKHVQKSHNLYIYTPF